MNPGTIYRTADGQVRMYVRTEQRPGSLEPEHLFVRVLDRIVMQHWTTETPPEAELIVDEDGRRQANEESWHRWISDRERDILIPLLQQACAWLPSSRANELRERYVTERAKLFE